MRQKMRGRFLAVALLMGGGWGSSVAISPSNTSAVPVESIVVNQKPNEPYVLFEQTATFGAEVVDGKHRGGDIIIPNANLDPCTARSGFCSYTVGIYSGALSRKTNVALRVTANRQSTFPGHKAIGYEVSAELPLEALTLDRSTTVMVLFAPTFPGVYEENLGFIAAEVQISFDGVVAHRYLRSYGLGVPTFIYVGNIVSAMRQIGTGRVGIMHISVLPISSKSDF